MRDPDPSARARRAGWLLAAVSLAAVLALGNLPLVTGHSWPKWDAADLFEPMFAMVGDAVRAGHLLTWDPWSGAGSPDWAEPEFGTTSPVLLAFSALPINPLHAYIAYWLSVWFFGGLGMLLLARHIGCSPPAALVVACGFTASGFFTGHAEHMSSLYSVAYLPWILWRFDAALELRGRAFLGWSRGAQAGALYGLSALGGYPEFTILTPGFLALWAIARIFAVEPAGRRATSVAAVRGWTAAIIVGFAVLAPPYAGLLLGTRGYTDYVGPRPRDVATTSNLLPAGALATVASPSLAGLNGQPKPIWPQTDISMTSMYMGSAIVVLALFALPGGRWRWYVAGIGAFFLCCAMGSQLPVRGWLYDLAPPTRYFRNPSLFRAYVVLVAAVLAAYGARDLRRPSPAQRVRLWRIAAVLGAVSVLVYANVLRTAGKPLPEPRAALVHLCLAWFGIAALSLLLTSARISPVRFLRFAAALACLDAVGSLYLSRGTLWDPGAPDLQAANAAHDKHWNVSGLDRSLLPPTFLGPGTNDRNLLLKRAVFDDYTTHQIFRNRIQTEILADDALNRMATTPERLWFSPSAVWMAPDQTSFELFQARAREPGLRPQEPGMVLHLPERMLREGREQINSPAQPQTGQAAACIPATVTELDYEPNLLSFRYEAPAAGYLMVTDRWADGWEASVNGKVRPVLGADFIYQAVAVEAGPNAIRFQYRPRWFWLSLVLSWSTLFVVVLFVARLP